MFSFPAALVGLLRILSALFRGESLNLSLMILLLMNVTKINPFFTFLKKIFFSLATE